MSVRVNRHFHVYILKSASNSNFVKVGKANNLKRVPYFSKSGYAGITDWQQMITLPVESNEAALALESMICVRLANQGFLMPKIMWEDLNKKGRFAGATECYNCHIEHAVKVAVEMANVYRDYVA